MNGQLTFQNSNIFIFKILWLHKLLSLQIQNDFKFALKNQKICAGLIQRQESSIPNFCPGKIVIGLTANDGVTEVWNLTWISYLQFVKFISVLTELSLETIHYPSGEFPQKFYPWRGNVVVCFFNILVGIKNPDKSVFKYLSTHQLRSFGLKMKWRVISKQTNRQIIATLELEVQTRFT